MQLSEWQRAVVALAVTVVTVAVVAALYVGRSVLVPIALAIFFTFVLAPLVARLQKAGQSTLQVDIDKLTEILAGKGHSQPPDEAA